MSKKTHKETTDIMHQVARMEQTKASGPGALPGDILSDLSDAFNFYDRN